MFPCEENAEKIVALKYSLNQVGVALEQQSTGWDLISDDICNSLCPKANLFLLSLLLPFHLNSRLFSVNVNNAIGSVVSFDQLVISFPVCSAVLSVVVVLAVNAIPHPQIA